MNVVFSLTFSHLEKDPEVSALVLQNNHLSKALRLSIYILHLKKKEDIYVFLNMTILVSTNRSI